MYKIKHGHKALRKGRFSQPGRVYSITFTTKIDELFSKTILLPYQSADA